MGVLALAGWFFALRLLERGVAGIDWFFEHLWKAIERGTKGRITASTLGHAAVRVRSHLAEKIEGWIAFAVGTIAEPFIEIFRSWFPPAEEAEEKPDQAEEPQQEAPQPDPDEKYRDALRVIGIRDGGTMQEAKKAYWAAFDATKAGRPGGDDEAAKKVTGAWEIIRAKRGWRR